MVSTTGSASGRRCKLTKDTEQNHRPECRAEAFNGLSENDGTIVRFNGPLGPLSGPMLVCVHMGAATQLKVVFGEMPMFFATEFVDADFQALKQFFINAAIAIEAVSPLDIETARRMAGDLIRAQLMGRNVLPTVSDLGHMKP